MQIEDLTKVEAEIKRFLTKLKAAKKRLSDDKYASITGCKETGAVKRAALDLKMELTNITR